MAARGRGVIVNVIGAGGKVASPTHIAGGAANAALMLATAGLGVAYAASGVRIVGVSPGLTETDRVAEGLKADAKLQGVDLEEARRRAVAKIPLGRLASPREIGRCRGFPRLGEGVLCDRRHPFDGRGAEPRGAVKGRRPPCPRPGFAR